MRRKIDKINKESKYIIDIEEVIPAMQKRSSRYLIKSIHKALDILEVLALEAKGLGLTEISKKLNMQLSTAHRILSTLKHRGYIEQSSKKGKYRLGLKTLEIGLAMQAQLQLLERALPHLQNLAEATKETVNLAILDQDCDEVVYIAKIDSPEVLKTDIKVGTKLLAHCTALGKVLLAFLPEDEFNRRFSYRNQLPTHTPRSLSTVEELKETLAKIRKQNFAIDNEEFKIGVKCVAAPIRDSTGKVIAAVSIAGPSSRLSSERIDEFRKLVVNTANEISVQLGFNTFRK